MSNKEKLEELYDNLKALDSLKQINANSDEEAYFLAITLMDFKESVNEIIKFINKLHAKQESTQTTVESLILIGEELRHILYHIHNSKFYNYLLDDDYSDIE